MVFAVATAPERRGIQHAMSPAAAAAAFLQTGAGPLDAETIACQLREMRAAGLVSIGTCGGLAPRMRTGALILPVRIVTAGGTELRVNSDWRNRVHAALESCCAVEGGPLLTTQRVLPDRAAKRDAHARTGAVGADMESADLGAAAGRAGIPFLAMRVVLDPQGVSIPPSATAGIDGNGDPTRLGLLRALCARPGDLPDLVRLVRRFGAAGAALTFAGRRARNALLAP
ncbi:MAG: hypothetical protein ACE5FS_16365 [Paracoccaceae bacterium]